MLPSLFVLLQEKHISRAARRCGLSQSAMSKIFSKAQKTFDDELLVRHEGGYRLTPYGQSLFKTLGEYLPRFFSLINIKKFDPKTTRRTFTISTTELESVHFIPKLAQQTALEMPNASLRFSQHNEDIISNINSGKIDLAVWNSTVPSGMSYKFLYSENYVALISNDNPFTCSKFTMDEYLFCTHIHTYNPHTNKNYVEELSTNNYKSDVTTSHNHCFTTSAHIASSSNMIATVPQCFAEYLANATGARIVNLPDEMSKYKVHLIWNDHGLVDDGLAYVIDTIMGIQP